MASDGTAQVGLAVPHSLIEDIVRGDIARVLGQNPKLLETVIKTTLSMTVRDPSTYRDTSLFEMTVRKMLEEETKQIFGEWIEQHRGEIRDALVKHLTECRAKKIREIAEKMAEGMASYRVSISLSVDG